MSPRIARSTAAPDQSRQCVRGICRSRWRQVQRRPSWRLNAAHRWNSYLSQACRFVSQSGAYHSVQTDKSTKGLLMPRSAPQAPFEQLRSEEHTSELQSLMRISYAVFCLKNTTKIQ